MNARIQDSLVLPPIQAFIDLIRANAKENMVVAEVGVYDGSTTFGYADIIKENNGHLYLVDWFKGNEGNEGTHYYREDGDPLFNSVQNEVKKRGLSNHVTILYGKSGDMARHIKNDELDICFLDADHTFKGCSNDIRVYYPKVKHGGIISGHDCEDINISHLFRPEDMFVDFLEGISLKERGITSVDGCHPGVITAVYNRFQNTVDIIPDPKGQDIPIWVKRVNKSEDKIHTIPKFV